MSKPLRYAADDRFAKKLKKLGIKTPKYGFTYLAADDPRFQPFHDAFAEYRSELVVEMGLPKPSMELYDWRTEVKAKLIYLNTLHPDERTKCPIQPVDLQFCRDARVAARSAGVKFRQATRRTLKTAEDELDYLTGWDAAVEDHQTVTLTPPAAPSSEVGGNASPAGGMNSGEDEAIKAAQAPLNAPVVKVAPKGMPGRKTDPEKVKHAVLANDLRGQSPQLGWKLVATKVTQEFGLTGANVYTAEKIRGLHRYHHGDKAQMKSGRKAGT